MGVIDAESHGGVPESSSLGGESEQGADAEGPSEGFDEEESDVTKWENELAGEVYHEIWLWQLRKNFKRKVDSEEEAWKLRWRQVPKAREIVKDIEKAKTYEFAPEEYGRGTAAWSDVYFLYRDKVSLSSYFCSAYVGAAWVQLSTELWATLLSVQDSLRFLE